MDHYFEVNRKAWNQRLPFHVPSALYDQEAFLAGKNSLFEIDQQLLGNVTGLKALHLQCHFGQDTISLARMGAKATGLDISNDCIAFAKKMAEDMHISEVDFICANVYDLPTSLNHQFDLVYSSYGTIIWLPDLDRWAQVIHRALKPGGRLVFVEFHPLVWIFDNDLQSLQYNYFNQGPIHEIEKGTYATTGVSDTEFESYTWNHPLSETISALLSAGMELQAFQEYDYAPCVFTKNLFEIQPGRFQFNHVNISFPMVFSLVATKK